ncbi:MAG: RusA family crossover junction endodeoxyribonuclease [Ruminococcus sp.]|nr:RusA family crossover junction endodeoxyribonuclease [Ruminococcus sp.]
MIQSFFLPMKPPTVTYQQGKRSTVNKHTGKPIYYEDDRLKDTRAKFTAHLSRHAPPTPLTCGVRLVTKWCYPITGEHQNGEYKLTKPDTDNMVKLFKDVMTELGFWKDDAQVASELTEKFYAKQPGIWVCIEVLPKNGY